MSQRESLLDHASGGAAAAGGEVSSFREVAIKRGEEKQFIAWTERAAETMERGAPGFLTQTIVKPPADSVNNLFVVLVKFTTEPAQNDWEKSATKKGLDAELDHLIDHKAQHAARHDVEAGAAGGSRGGGVETMGVVVVTDAVDGAPVAVGPQPLPLWKLTLLFILTVEPVNIFWYQGGYVLFWVKALGPYWSQIMIVAPFVFIIDYILVPLCLKLFGSILTAPWKHHTSEPLKSLNEGLCCFAPSRAVLDLQEELTKEKAITHALRTSVDRRLTRLETAASSVTGSDIGSHDSDAGDRTEAAMLVVAQTDAMERALSSSGVTVGAGGASSSPRRSGARRSSVVERGGATGSGRVTMVMRHRVKPGMEEDYEASINDIANFAHTHYAGHMGTNMIRPQKTYVYPGGPQAASEYVTTFQYDTVEHMQTWMHSADRARLAQAIVRTLEAEELEAHGGFSMFHAMTSPPSKGGPPTARPPQWKNSIMAFFGIGGCNWGINVFVLPVLMPGAPLDWWMATVDTLILCPLAVYIVMPTMGALFSRWLAPAKPQTNPLFKALTFGFIGE